MSQSLRAAFPVVALCAIGLLLLVMAELAPGGAIAASQAAHTSISTLPRTRLGTHNFGSLVGDTPQGHTFQMLNTGVHEWRVIRTWTECKCVSLESHSASVKPGEQLELAVRLNPAAQPEGELPVEAYALVEPGPWILVAPISAWILKRPHLSPAHLAPEVVGQDELFAGEFELRAPFALDCLGFDIAAAPEDVVVHEVHRSESSNGSRVLLMISGRIGVLRQRRDLTVEFDVHPCGEVEGERLSLAVRVNRLREISISPRTLFLDPQSPAGEAGAWIKNHRGEIIRDLVWTVSPQGSLSCSYDPNNGQLIVKLPTHEPAWGSECTVHVVSGDGKTADLPVKLLGRGL